MSFDAFFWSESCLLMLPPKLKASLHLNHSALRVIRESKHYFNSQSQVLLGTMKKEVLSVQLFSLHLTCWPRIFNSLSAVLVVSAVLILLLNLIWWQKNMMNEKKKKNHLMFCSFTLSGRRWMDGRTDGWAVSEQEVGMNWSWLCFSCNPELHLYRACKKDKLSGLIPLTQPFFRHLITLRRIVPPLANVPVSSMWSPVNRTYQSKYLIRTRPAAKHEALRSRLKVLSLQA